MYSEDELKKFEEQAKGLEHVAEMMLHMAKILRGEVVDRTGLGYWRILCNHLGRVMDVKVIPKSQYEAFRELADADYEKRVAERDAK